MIVEWSWWLMLPMCWNVIPRRFLQMWLNIWRAYMGLRFLDLDLSYAAFSHIASASRGSAVVCWRVVGWCLFCSLLLFVVLLLQLSQILWLPLCWLSLLFVSLLLINDELCTRSSFLRSSNQRWLSNLRKLSRSRWVCLLVVVSNQRWCNLLNQTLPSGITTTGVVKWKLFTNKSRKN